MYPATSHGETAIHSSASTRVHHLMTHSVPDANTYSPGWTGELYIAAEQLNYMLNYVVDKTGDLSKGHCVGFNKMNLAWQTIWLILKIDTQIVYSGGPGPDTPRQAGRDEAQMSMRCPAANTR
jgi:hypothetical protein